MSQIPGFDQDPRDFRRSLKKSSFALGALFLAPSQRRELEIFYAFCRAVDDCADDHPPAQAKLYLARWRQALAKAPDSQAPLLVRELHALAARHAIPLALFRELVTGALSDLRPKVRFTDARALETYCHQVAGVVGQICLPLFGVDRVRGKEYAETLARAFQLINILRDVREDAARGRIYFTLADLKAQGVEEKDFLQGKIPQALLALYAERARVLLARSDALARALPRQGLGPSRMMRRLYGSLLDQMQKDGLRVLEKRYRLRAIQKIWAVLGGWRR
ncbi:MAG: squalene/phytoene synthase family protein [candidate division FCPU426 bacterium]